MEAGREILITECDLLRDYLTAVSPGPHCSWEQDIGQEGYRAGRLLIETLDILCSLVFFSEEKEQTIPSPLA